MSPNIDDLFGTYERRDIKKIIESTNRFRYSDSLAKSNAKVVARVQDTHDNQQKVLKILMDNEESKSKADLEYYLWREINLKGDSTHILGVLDDPIRLGDRYGTLTELALGSLAGWITELKNHSKKLSEMEVVEYMAQIIKGTQQGHIIGVSHNDLKPSNILLFREPLSKSILLKVGDWANSTQNEKITTTVKGTFGYMAPEAQLVKGAECNYSPRSDIYSLGIMLFELLHPTFQIPFEASKTAYSKQMQKGQTFLKGRLNELKCSEKYKDIILICLKPEVDDRYASVDDFLLDLTGEKSVPKPPVDMTNYNGFIEKYNALIQILSDANLHQGTKYKTAALPNIDKIQSTLYELRRLDTMIRSSELKGRIGLLSDIESKIKDATNRRYQEATKDKEQLISLSNEYMASVNSGGKAPPLKNLVEIYQIVLCWGPPLATLQSDRRNKGFSGKERYSLAEIKSGEYKKALPASWLPKMKNM